MNLIVTCPRNFEQDASEEIKMIFDRFGFDEPQTTITGMPGIITISFVQNPLDIIQKIVQLIDDEPWAIRYSQRIIPIQASIKTDIQDMLSTITKMQKIMTPAQTYRITIKKRHSDLSSSKIITQIASMIPNTVSLDDPDWVILIEILGTKTGISVIHPHQIVSIEKLKRAISE